MKVSANLRRTLSSLLIVLLLSAAFPLNVFGATMAQPGTATTIEDTPVTIKLQAKDAPGAGAITPFATGTATRPGGPDTATVSITVDAVNDPPTCSGDTSSDDEDTDQTGTVACSDLDGNPLAYSKVAGPAHGTAAVAADGDWTYSPYADYSGPDSFTFRANDGTVNSGTSTLSITVISVNDAPVCADDSSSGGKNQLQSGTLVCTDADDDTLTYSKVSGPAHGSAAVAADGDWTYNPTHNYTGSDSFDFKANDGTSDSVVATMDLTVTPTNDPPVCAPDSSSGSEDNDQNGTITCTDADDDTLTYSKVAGPAHGTAAVAADGDWTYSPNADYSGPDSFTFRANDGTVNSNTATMSITVTSANDPPVCSADTSSGNEDTDQSGTLVCTDADDDTLTYSKVAGPTHGSATVDTDGAWSYSPDGDYSGPDSFTFRANDGTDNSNTVAMSITVTPTNDPPVCAPDSSSGSEDNDQNGTITCTDADDDTLTYSKVAGPAHGTAAVAADGDWTYSPNADYSGPDSFTFRANDGTVNSNTATMSITVTSANDPPVCSADTSSGNEDTDQSGTLVCTDADDDTLTYSKVAGPTHGSATVDTDGAWSYSPDGDYSGPDSFTFRANDGTDNSNTVAMSITVTPTNDPPVCSGLTLSTSTNVAVGGTVTCTDPEDDTLTLRIGAQPASGTVSPFNASTGAFTYTPDTDVTGADSFTVIANDGASDSLPALVGIGVDNQAPVCSNPSAASGNEDVQLTGLLSCTDADADTLSYLVAGQPSHGGATINPTTGHWTYTPDADYNGADSFTVAASDGVDQSNAATVSITLDPVNDAPDCSPGSSSGNEETSQSGTASCTDVDLGAGTLTYAVSTIPTKGTVTVFDTTTGDWTYVPLVNRTGADSFKVTASDGQLTSTAATISLTLVDVNDAPVAKTDTKTISATSTTTISVTGNDFSGPVIGGVTSEPTDAVTVTSATGASRGSLSIAAGGQGIVYDPRGCGSGDDTFSYTITDSHGATATAAVFVTIARPGTHGLSKKPITDTPTIAFVSGSTIGSTTPMKLTWCGVTAGGAVKAYRIDQSTNGGSSYKSMIKSTKGTSSTRNLGVSTQYRWRARTTDKKGRVSSYRTSLVARTARYQDTSSSIVYSGPWTSSSTSSASGGTEQFTTFAGADATLLVPSTVRSFAIVGPRSASRGSFQVLVDSVVVATVSEKASSTQYRRVLFVGSLTPGTSHTIQLVAVGNGRVDLDAILTLGT